MAHLFKSFELKANENGIIEGYFSTYDKTPDSYGDIIEPGAFTQTIKAREESGHPFPLCFNHDFSAIIGAVKSIKDTEKGPFIEAEFLDTQLAQDVRKMLLSGAIYQFSFAYDVKKSRKPTVEEAEKGIMNVLTDLEVFEVSVVTVPANQNAVVTEVKSGRRNSKADEDVITDVIRELGDTIEDINEIAALLTTRIESLRSLIDQGEEDKPREEEAEPEENEPENNAEPKAEDSKDDENSEKAVALLETIKKMKEADPT